MTNGDRADSGLNGSGNGDDQRLSWVLIRGRFEDKGHDISFDGTDTASPVAGQADAVEPEPQTKAPPAAVGLAVCNQRFSEGEVSVDVRFDAIVDGAIAEIVLQYDPTTDEMLNAGIGRGRSMFGIRQWVTEDSAPSPEQPGSRRRKTWRPLRGGGDGLNLREGRFYSLRVAVRGSTVRLALDGVDVCEAVVPNPMTGRQPGLFCVNRGGVTFRNFRIASVQPQAFVVMQFNTREFDDLFDQVIDPTCRKVGLKAFRADQTQSPGLVVTEMTKQIAESRVVIAEITPANPNVYYEVGYADALRKPLILIADKTIKELPFDIRPYRTIFYENSIGGKQRVEETLLNYLNTIMGTGPSPSA